MATLHLQVVSLDGVVYDERDVKEATLKTSEGVITVLANHIPLIAPIRSCSVRALRENGTTDYVDVSAGVIEVRSESEVVVLVNTAKRQ